MTYARSFRRLKVERKPLSKAASEPFMPKFQVQGLECERAERKRAERKSAEGSARLPKGLPADSRLNR